MKGRKEKLAEEIKQFSGKITEVQLAKIAAENHTSVSTVRRYLNGNIGSVVMAEALLKSLKICCVK